MTDEREYEITFRLRYRLPHRSNAGTTHVTEVVAASDASVAIDVLAEAYGEDLLEIVGVVGDPWEGL